MVRLQTVAVTRLPARYRCPLFAGRGAHPPRPMYTRRTCCVWSNVHTHTRVHKSNGVHARRPRNGKAVVWQCDKQRYNVIFNYYYYRYCYYWCAYGTGGGVGPRAVRLNNIIFAGVCDRLLNKHTPARIPRSDQLSPPMRFNLWKALFEFVLCTPRPTRPRCSLIVINDFFFFYISISLSSSRSLDRSDTIFFRRIRHKRNDYGARRVTRSRLSRRLPVVRHDAVRRGNNSDLVFVKSKQFRTSIVNAIAIKIKINPRSNVHIGRYTHSNGARPRPDSSRQLPVFFF